MTLIAVNRGVLGHGAVDETRTRNSLLGRQGLHQLNYYRILKLLATAPCTSASTPVNRNDAGKVPWKATLCSAVFEYHLSGDSDGARTHDLQRDRLT